MIATSKLIILGVLSVGAGGIALDSYMRVPHGSAKEPSASQFNRLGYLPAKQLSNGISGLPPPPLPGSAAMQYDEQIRALALPLRGTPRYALAQLDAVRTQQGTVDAFQCAFGTAITAERTPRLYELLSRVRIDVRAASYPAKSHFRRQRPFIVHNVHSCYPSDEAMTAEDGSYPSARGAVGWAYALVLAKLNPKRSAEILQRGKDFDQSRTICDQEWQSDIDGGHIVATTIVDHLQHNALYQSDFTAARSEVAAELASAISPAKDCRSEMRALATR
jgi:acid phosphatase (class A)